MTDLWCRKITCTHNEGKLYTDGKGMQGYCTKNEVQIDKEGKCEDEKHI